MKKLSTHGFLLAGLMLVLSGGCAQPPTGPLILPHKQQAEVLAYLDQYQPAVRDQQQTLLLPELVNHLDSKRVVFVGERHDRYEHHLNQLAILRLLHARHNDMAIGVEWFQQPFQDSLDQYLAGKINETRLLMDSQYLNRWGYDFRMLRPVLEFARQQGIPVIALNADVEITRKIGRGGLQSLTTEERSLLPATITPTPESEREALKEIYNQHADASDENFDNFLSVQRVWDLTMAHAIVDHLDAHPGRHMVVFAGDGHLAKDRAIPRVVAELRPDWNTSVVHSRNETGDEPNGADYLVLSTASSLPPIGKLGVWLENGEGGALIKQVVEDSAAAQAGLKDGDIITALNDTPTPDSASLKLALTAFTPDQTVLLSIRRPPADKATDKSVKVKLH